MLVAASEHGLNRLWYNSGSYFRTFCTDGFSWFLPFFFFLLQIKLFS